MCDREGTPDRPEVNPDPQERQRPLPLMLEVDLREGEAGWWFGESRNRQVHRTESNVMFYTGSYSGLKTVYSHSVIRGLLNRPTVHRLSGP